MRKIVFLIAVFVGLAGAACAKAQGPTIPAIKPIVVSYNVYVGGVHFLSGDVLFQEQKKKYRATVKAHTHGFWYDILPWDTMLDASGAIKGDHFVPAHFITRDEFKHKPKVTEMTFDAKGYVTPRFDPPSNDKNRDIVTPEQSRNALDPVTALLQMLATASTHNDCDVMVPVFDGKRRFDIAASDGGFDDISEEGYSAFKGHARICDASFTMIAGAWKEGEKSGFWKLNDSEAGREPFHIWLAKIAPNLPEMPVRLESGSVWGLIVMHLAGWHYASPDELK